MHIFVIFGCIVLPMVWHHCRHQNQKLKAQTYKGHFKFPTTKSIQIQWKTLLYIYTKYKLLIKLWNFQKIIKKRSGKVEEMNWLNYTTNSSSKYHFKGALLGLFMCVDKNKHNKLTNILFSSFVCHFIRPLSLFFCILLSIYILSFFFCTFV
jgi:hypothetical protein